MKRKFEKLKNLLKSYKKVMIAFSGGVDSSLLLFLALKVLGKNNVFPVIFISPTYPFFHLKRAINFLNNLGIKGIFLFTEELKREEFIKNPPERCYYCKKDSYQKLLLLKDIFKVNKIIEGTNYSDLKDYRPGIKALKELNIESPYLKLKIKKEEIRKKAKDLKIPNYDAPSSPCLSSRIPFYERIDEEKLIKVEKGEEFLKSLGLKDFRLRMINNKAKIELKREEDYILVIKNRKRIIDSLKKIGFSEFLLDLRGYQPMGIQWIMRNY
ncbi:MAG: ATP-dependent sacrificial sulfur transferase LarE [candidate division WOR-3 bacterium]|nr:ATP-dependent sacrificial sulfur transferase LarE [candidate division WOR-3 bacterium]MCX7837311.1 ATP-dependent sacrificial sulfur transferase LarE [candidate division WOR-3 bacterium]MDW8114679.1 ATP-dependent sacrificial sulfur transferase LarE [candidate division WOR-3 bacterium]